MRASAASTPACVFSRPLRFPVAEHLRALALLTYAQKLSII